MCEYTAFLFSCFCLVHVRVAMAVAVAMNFDGRSPAVRLGRPPLTVSRSAEGKYLFSNTRLAHGCTNS